VWSTGNDIVPPGWTEFASASLAAISEADVSSVPLRTVSQLILPKPDVPCADEARRDELAVIGAVA
jgi:hypothetical protein